MQDERLPVFWICGAPGVGKSATSWALFEKLGEEGVAVAYVDIDQLGMLYPEPADDPDRHRLKVDALNAVLPRYAAAGAEVLVVSGIVDPHAGADLASRFPTASVTFCLLTVDETTLQKRIAERGWDAADADEAVADARALRRAPFVDEVIDTTGSALAAVVAQVRPLVGRRGTPAGPAGDPTSRPSPTAAPDLVVVSGPRACGSSTVAFHLARSRWSSGSATGFVDLQQLSFVRRPGADGCSETSLGIANLAALRDLFGSRGADLMVASAHLHTAAEHAALRSTARDRPAVIVRLRATPSTLAGHIRARSHGSEARLAGDDLVGAPEARQAQVLEVALSEQRTLEADRAEDVVVDVGERTVDEVTSELQHRVRVARRTNH